MGMIQYNKVELRDNKIIIDFQIKDESYYRGVTIDGFDVYTPLTWEKKIAEFGARLISGLFSSFKGEVSTLGTKSDFFIILPVVDGLASIPADSPCGSDVINNVAVYNKDILLNKGMTYLKGLGDTCNISRDFIDFILRTKALDMSIATCNFDEAIKYWNMFIGGNGTPVKGCGCYGK